MTATLTETETPTVTFTTITPEHAAELLKQNTHNRNMRFRVVDQYARDMAAGKWIVNGESVKIAEDGTVIDGQHRLSAAVQSNKPFQTLLIVGLPIAAQESLDGGAKRAYADILRLRGEAATNDLAALVNKVSRYNKVGFRSALLARESATVQEMNRTLDKNSHLRDIVKRARNVSLPVHTRSSVMGLCMYVFDQIDREDSEHFFTRLQTGEMLKRDNPIFALRSQFLQLADQKNAHATNLYIGAVTVKAWNRFRAGEPCHVLSFKQGGASPEKFPEPK